MVLIIVMRPIVLSSFKLIAKMIFLTHVSMNRSFGSCICNVIFIRVLDAVYLKFISTISWVTSCDDHVLATVSCIGHQRFLSTILMFSKSSLYNLVQVHFHDSVRSGCYLRQVQEMKCVFIRILWGILEVIIKGDVSVMPPSSICILSPSRH